LIRRLIAAGFLEGDCAIAEGLKMQGVRLPDLDARVLLRWADRSYGF